MKRLIPLLLLLMLIPTAAHALLPTATRAPVEYLSVDENGLLTGMTGNELIVNVGTDAPAYLIAGRVTGTPDGFTRAENYIVSDPNVPSLVFLPTDGTAPAQQILIGSAKGEALTMLEQYLSRIDSYFEFTYVGDIILTAEDGRARCAVLIEYVINDQNDAPMEYDQSVIVYTDCGIEDRSLYINAVNAFSDPADFRDRDELLALCESCIPLISLP